MSAPLFFIASSSVMIRTETPRLCADNISLARSSFENEKMQRSIDFVAFEIYFANFLTLLRLGKKKAS